MKTHKMKRLGSALFDLVWHWLFWLFWLVPMTVWQLFRGSWERLVDIWKAVKDLFYK